MNKIFLFSIALSGILLADNDNVKNLYINKDGFWDGNTLISAKLPLTTNFLSIENGGTLPAIDAYSDGVGLVLDDALGFNNAAMNNLVFQFGQQAKANGTDLASEVLTLVDNPGQKDIENANILAQIKGNVSSISTTPLANNNCQTGFNGNYNGNIDCWQGADIITNLATGWANLKSVSGYIDLEGDYSGNTFMSLDNLKNLKTANTVYLGGAGFNNLNGLLGLTSANDIEFWNVPNLTDISGLKNVITNNGYLYLDLSKPISVKLPISSPICTNWSINGHINGNSIALSDICNVPTDGTPCDDGATETINDKWINGLCRGTPSGTCGGVPGTYISIPTTKTMLQADLITYAGQLNKICTFYITDMSYLFSGYDAFLSGTNSNFNEDISSWNTSNVNNMKYMFYYATSFNQNINNWNVSNVTNMEGMFNSATKFNQPLNNWNISNVNNTSYMFNQATSFNQPLNNWNTINIVNMEGMFNNAIKFNQPLNNWNTTKVINTSGMFGGANLFNQTLNNWNVSNVTNMNSMFFEATSFNQTLNNWNVSNVRDMSALFYNATAFNQTLNNWNVSNVTNMNGMFGNATAFNQALNNWNILKVTNMNGMFAGASSFNQNIHNWSPSFSGKPFVFDQNAPIENNILLEPVWK